MQVNKDNRNNKKIVLDVTVDVYFTDNNNNNIFRSHVSLFVLPSTSKNVKIRSAKEE